MSGREKGFLAALAQAERVGDFFMSTLEAWLLGYGTRFEHRSASEMVPTQSARPGAIVAVACQLSIVLQEGHR